MKLLKSLVGLAAVASVIPFKLEKKEDGKSFSAKALLWRVDYTAAENDDEKGQVSVNILEDFLDGVQDVANKVLDAVRKDECDEDECDCEEEEAIDCDCEEACECKCDDESDEVSAN